MIEENAAVTAAFVVYLAVMLAIGLYAAKYTETSEDYFLGGRRLGPWSAALSAGASDMSGWLLLGLPGFAFVAGAEAVWVALGLLVGTYLNWLLIAKRLRHYSVALNDAVTLPEFLARRFADDSKLIQSLSAIFILLFFLFYTSSGLVAGGKLFETVFGFDYTAALFIGTGCIVIYTLFGGFLAVAWTDLVQGLLMMAALIIVPAVAVQYIGGGSYVYQAISQENIHLLDIWTDKNGQPLTLISIVSLMAWGLGYFGQPHILARFAAMKNGQVAVPARRIAVAWSAIAMLGAILTGFAGMVFVDSHLGGHVADVERIFMLLVDTIFHPLVAGILLAAILAAIMSTADSQLLVSSSALAEDMYRQLLNPGATSREVVVVARLSVLVLALIALMLAMNPNSTVLGLVSYAWAGFGAVFGPVVLLSLYWRRMNRAGAAAGMISGGVTVVVWAELSGGIFELYEIVPGVIVASLSVMIVSLISRKPSNTVSSDFNKYQQGL
ncbi:Osmoregulated proline transporter OpuE [Sinobacterium norvegicum]|uniref:Sodium/proline symporter n=1 Tax=Sinobacterium norvegicum TaxID=1641715 RepID=A0ABM9AFI1_9GAMM|nr:sodium/proline symporter PutP [Sinobacterium norvegicum]CAH0991883.1 Osmoregulated proline transporter OpuE [Sinobacterium norvegicum]